MLKVTIHEEEQQRLLPNGDNSPVGSSQSKWARRSTPLIIAAVFVFAFGVSANISKSTSSPLAAMSPSTLAAAATVSGTSSFSIKISNEYGDIIARRASSGAQDYPFLSGAFLIEPHKKNEAVLSTATDFSYGEVEWALMQDDSIE